ncbi:ATP-binding protein, partial [Gemmatimonadota bacterium]
RIRPRARLLRTIGADLISSEVVAVIELVRNCYDADATLVELVFEGPENPEDGRLEIRDNGHGMSRDILLGPWLEPATDHKAAGNQEGLGGERSPGGRRRLGSKGVGRFAAQRLGGHLQVWTRTKGSKTELEAEFDWDLLEREAYLDEIRIPWQEHRSKSQALWGTHLRISHLHNQWSPDRFEKLKLALSRLINPSVRGDFKIEISINGAREEIQPALEASLAMYSLTGAVEPGGICRIHYLDLEGDEEHWERTVIWPENENCGPFEFEISAWDLDSDALRHFFNLTGYDHGILNFRRALRDHSGISLYRDGFRVLPYGESDNDWLRLDRRRVNNPTMRLSNNQILGHIQLTADGNPDLRDQTNREGLVTNEPYAHLQEVVLELLQFLEVRRYTARRSMDLGSQRKTTSLPTVGDEEDEERLDLLIESLARSGESQVMELRTMFRELRELARESVKHYAGLASAGHVAGLVFKQLNHPLRQIQSDLGLVLDDIESLAIGEEDREDLSLSVRQALQHAGTMSARMARLDPLAIGGRGRRVSRISLDEALRPVIQAFEEEGGRQGVSIHYEPKGDLEVVTNREVAQHSLANLLDNAVWWASNGEAPSPVVRVRLTPAGFSVSDNGPGIPEEHRDLIYEPTFSTRDGAHGLGLTLARDLLGTIGGRIRLAKLQPATFVVQLTEG